MKKEEVCRIYHIAPNILNEYDLALSDAEELPDRDYTESDIARLCQLSGLIELGFTRAEACRFLLLEDQSDTQTEQKLMLDGLRTKTLREIHHREAQLDRLDYLRHCCAKKAMKEDEN